MSADLGTVSLFFDGSVPRIFLQNKISAGEGRYASIGVDLRQSNAKYGSDLEVLQF